MKKVYQIEVYCANCANKMEEAVGKLPGVTQATVSFMTQKLTVEWDGTEESELKKAIKTVCQKIDSDFEIA